MGVLVAVSQSKSYFSYKKGKVVIRTMSTLVTEYLMGPIFIMLAVLVYTKWVENYTRDSFTVKRFQVLIHDIS